MLPLFLQNISIMRTVYLILSLISLSALSSCNKEVKSEKGGIDIISNVYFNASKNLEKMQNFHVSRLNYSGDSIIELVPDLAMRYNECCIFYPDSLYYDLGGEHTANAIISDIKKSQKGQSIFDKKAGAIFTKEWVPNYEHRKILVILSSLEKLINVLKSMLRRVSPDITSTPQILSYPIHYTNKLTKIIKEELRGLIPTIKRTFCNAPTLTKGKMG